jgi:hypothetical protein
MPRPRVEYTGVRDHRRGDIEEGKETTERKERTRYTCGKGREADRRICGFGIYVRGERPKQNGRQTRSIEDMKVVCHAPMDISI